MTQLFRNSNLRLPLATLLVVLLNLTSSTTSNAFTFDKYAIHAFSSYGAVHDSLTLQAPVEITKSINTNINSTITASLDFGWIYDKYNSTWAGKYSFTKLIIGPELRYANLRIKKIATGLDIPTQDEVTTLIDPNDPNPPTALELATPVKFNNKKLLNAVFLGAIARYYINEAVFIKGSLGLNMTFSTEIHELVGSHKFSVEVVHASELRPYVAIGIGYDIKYFSTKLEALYMTNSGKDHSNYFLYTIGVGLNYNFK